MFIHYSGANIREKSFLECLQQPLFKEYRKGQPFNNNHLRPCPMLENPEYLPQMVARSGAHSTDLEAPESVEHLCNKCESYPPAGAPRPKSSGTRSTTTKLLSCYLPIHTKEPSRSAFADRLGSFVRKPPTESSAAFATSSTIFT